MMMARLAALGALFSLAAAAPPPIPNWTRTAVRTPEGGIRVGNPRAARRFVEVANYTCGHCAQFAAAGGPTIARAIRAGTLNMEVRPFVNNAIGLSATVAARCAPGRFLAVNDALYARQNEWIPAAAAYLEAAGAQTADPMQLRRIAERGGIARIALAHGVTAPRLAACYADRVQLAVIVRTSAAVGAMIEGTPAFAIGGQTYEGLDWPAFAARLGLDPIN